MAAPSRVQPPRSPVSPPPPPASTPAKLPPPLALAAAQPSSSGSKGELEHLHEACNGIASLGGASASSCSSTASAAAAADADAAAGPEVEAYDAPDSGRRLRELPSSAAGDAGCQSSARHARFLDLEDCVTQFLFDWDDTLLPTSTLQDMPQLYKLPPHAQKVMQRIDQEAAALLCEALALPGESRVTVLTNAMTTWVDKMVKVHLPRVGALLEMQGGRVALRSARPDDSAAPPRPSTGGDNGSNDDQDDSDAGSMSNFAEWKSEAVGLMAESLQRVVADSGDRVLQIVSIGDSLHDLEAACVLAGKIRAKELYVKTVRMQFRPSMRALVSEIRAVRLGLVPLCRRRRDLHTAVRSLARARPPAPRPSQGLASMPALLPLPVPAAAAAAQAPPPQSARGAAAGPLAVGRHRGRRGAVSSAHARMWVFNFPPRRPAARGSSQAGLRRQSD